MPSRTTVSVGGALLVVAALLAAVYLAPREPESRRADAPAPAADMPALRQRPGAEQDPEPAGIAAAGHERSPRTEPGGTSFEEYLSTPGASIEAWLMPAGGLDAARAMEIATAARFDRLVWSLEENATAALQDKAAWWLQQLYAIDIPSAGVVTVHIACGESLCAAQFRSVEAGAVKQYVTALHDSDLPMYAIVQLLPEKVDGTEVARFLFTTAAEANFVELPAPHPDDAERASADP